jgi:hypothetical protein
MKDLSKKKRELENNSISVLSHRFDMLLKGLDTEKDKFKNDEVRKRAIKSIKSFTYYRIKEKIIDLDKGIGAIILRIDKSKLEDINEIKSIYSDMYKISPSRLRGSYYVLKAKEENKKLGEGIISKFFALFKS